MFLIAGLGNPGDKYVNTRHNIGFMVLEELSRLHHLPVTKKRHKALIAKGRLDDNNIILAKPQTFMNLSGESVRSVCFWHRIKPENVIIVQDDIALPAGKLRIRFGGSDGGHNGIKSITKMLGTDKYIRLKIGVGKNGENLSNYVLDNIPPKELEEIYNPAIARSCEAVRVILKDGYTIAMNKFN